MKQPYKYLALKMLLNFNMILQHQAPLHTKKNVQPSTKINFPLSCNYSKKRVPNAVVASEIRMQRILKLSPFLFLNRAGGILLPYIFSREMGKYICHALGKGKTVIYQTASLSCF